MPRKSSKVPAYCRHKASGQAVVQLDGVDYYLGRYGSAESHESYERKIIEWRTKTLATCSGGNGKHGGAKAPNCSLTVEHVLALFWRHAKLYYVRAGKPTGELSNIKYVIRPLR